MCMDIAMKKAKENGVGWVTAKGTCTSTYGNHQSLLLFWRHWQGPYGIQGVCVCSQLVLIVLQSPIISVSPAGTRCEQLNKVLSWVAPDVTAKTNTCKEIRHLLSKSTYTVHRNVLKIYEHMYNIIMYINFYYGNALCFRASLSPTHRRLWCQLEPGIFTPF